MLIHLSVVQQHLNHIQRHAVNFISHTIKGSQTKHTHIHTHTPTDLVEHVPEVVLRAHPRGHSITEEDKVLEGRRGIDSNKDKEYVLADRTTDSPACPQCWIHLLKRQIKCTQSPPSPGPRPLGLHQSSRRSLGRRNLSPRCRGCSVMTYTCHTHTHS